MFQQSSRQSKSTLPGILLVGIRFIFERKFNVNFRSHPRCTVNRETIILPIEKGQAVIDDRNSDMSL